MAKKLTLQRVVFLFVLVAVFLFTYLADTSIYVVIFNALMAAFPWAMRFYVPFFILSSIGLIVYYLVYENTNDSRRYLPWIKIYSIAFVTGFVVCSLIIYFKIFTNHTFDP